MNYSRLVRLRFLLPLLFALSVAALLVRARLPRPQTEGDKVLWQMGETTPFLEVAFGEKGSTPFKSLHVSDRQGIRDILRSFVATSPFIPLTAKNAFEVRPSPVAPAVMIFVAVEKGKPALIYLIQGAHDYRLLRYSSPLQSGPINRLSLCLVAHTDAASVLRVRQALQNAQTKVQQHQVGYTKGTFRRTSPTRAAPIRVTPPLTRSTPLNPALPR